ncbi:unnamed protein product, partial [Ectocarpus fasciculatus]
RREGLVNRFGRCRDSFSCALYSASHIQNSSCYEKQSNFHLFQLSVATQLQVGVSEARPQYEPQDLQGKPVRCVRVDDAEEPTTSGTNLRVSRSTSQRRLQPANSTPTTTCRYI